MWGNERSNPCLRYYTGVYDIQKSRNKYTVPGWRTRLHFRGDWGPKIEDADDDPDDNAYGENGLEIKCRRTPNWRRLRPVIDYNEYYY